MVSIVDELPGNSEAIKRLRSEITLGARTSLPVLLLGETGSGKEVAAHLIHRLSTRSSQPFVAINIAAIPDSLASAEIVGYGKGAFTGATESKPGLLERANEGTVFLDEIAEASLDLQSLLLSVLETNSVRRLGEGSSLNLNVRLLSATNRDLDEAVEAGAFRADLANRLSAVRIRIPPLRERQEEIPALAEHMLTEISKRVGKQFVLTEKAAKRLQQYTFPGNFRELHNILERAAIYSPDGSIDEGQISLPTRTRAKRRRPSATVQLQAARSEAEGLKRELESVRARSIPAQPIWQGRGFVTFHDYCFVLMPFGDTRDLQAVYRDHVKPVLERCGLRCERADDIYDVTGVMQSVWEGINKARIVVADLTERNANVFYELGIAHTLGKPVIMLAQSIDSVPFDLRHLRCIVYSYTPRGARMLEENLERTIRTVLSGSAEFGRT